MRGVSSLIQHRGSIPRWRLTHHAKKPGSFEGPLLPMMVIPLSMIVGALFRRFHLHLRAFSGVSHAGRSIPASSAGMREARNLSASTLLDATRCLACNMPFVVVPRIGDVGLPSWSARREWLSQIRKKWPLAYVRIVYNTRSRFGYLFRNAGPLPDHIEAFRCEIEAHAMLLSAAYIK